MNLPIHLAIRQQLQKTLNGFFEAKTKKISNDIAKEEDPTKLAELNEKLKQEKDKYQLHNWIENEATKMMSSLKFGTHISKGIHSSSRGHNVTFQPIVDLSEEYYIGSHTPGELAIDANGNSASLPLATFLKTLINDSTLEELIITDSPLLGGVFNDDSTKSEAFRLALKDTLTNTTETPSVDGFNKQILWPTTDNAIQTDSYINLVPLYPSALSNHFYQQVRRIHEIQREVRDKRNKSQDIEAPYRILRGLAITKLGGANAQNVGRLNAQQNGQHYLLPSYPPFFKRIDNIPLSRSDSSIYNDKTRHICRNGFEKLKEVTKLRNNDMHARDRRQAAIDEILFNILFIADEIKANWEGGWSENYSLISEEKQWLDPSSCVDSTATNWIEKVAERFARWILLWLQKELPGRKDEFAAEEFDYMKKEMKDTLIAKNRYEEV
ncbi:CRISPR type I-F/YPEST-associated protein Csy1 [Oligella urethralis]|uniref:type I-F CRISPR-associated protein Csy1 n=1 Tax=Oligella urethralis TaxID=90245 RepID=UPI000DFB64E7|nr:type I-F CRISPR-associated protein Csy1 [Oligella urethralis]SUA55223.1 CRISPR type I-F/YPEST-associated protein Csy1 [Oligella urethralis]